jgi:hypothetical protein
VFNLITLFWSYILFDIFGLIRRRDPLRDAPIKETPPEIPEEYASNVFDDLNEEDFY